MIIRRGRLIKKIISVLVLFALMITIIINIRPQKTYAYTLDTDVDGTISVKYTVNYTFYEHNKTNPDWRCDDWGLGETSTFDVPVQQPLKLQFFNLYTPRKPA